TALPNACTAPRRRCSRCERAGFIPPPKRRSCAAVFVGEPRGRRKRFMSAQAPIVIEGVSHTYRPPRGRPLLALDDVSLAVRPREFVALLGPSGCGKSTLLYLIGGFLRNETGTVSVDGKPVCAPGPDRGIVFQHFALFPWKTVRGNILYGLERQGLPRPQREEPAQT